MKPVILDLFSGAGGAAAGYQRAGFHTVGVDIKPQPNYPSVLIVDDALAYLAKVIDLAEDMASWGAFAAIHASPPCQRWSAATPADRREEHPDLIEPTRQLLDQTDLPWIIENVENAPLVDPLMLCGTHFDLGATGENGIYRQLQRHRLFEVSGFEVPQPVCNHDGAVIGVYGSSGGSQLERGYRASAAERSEAMDIDWMTTREMSQAIPPAFTSYIGTHLMRALG